MNNNSQNATLLPLIISAANNFKSELSGRNFLYIVGSSHFVVSFPTYSFLHLTGVDTTLTSGRFYSNATQNQLTANQFYLRSHNFSNAKAKLSSLQHLSNLTKTNVYMIEDLKTNTATYKICIADFVMTLGLTKSKNIYVPKSLRVNDRNKNYSSKKPVDFIFSMDAHYDKNYGTLLYKTPGKKIPSDLNTLISKELLKQLS